MDIHGSFFRGGAPMIEAGSVLIVVDVQNDFLPGGALAVPKGEEVIPVINRLSRRFENVILTQDWHPAGHVSFASTHAGRKPFETIELALRARRCCGPTTASKARRARHSTPGSTCRMRRWSCAKGTAPTSTATRVSWRRIG